MQLDPLSFTSQDLFRAINQKDITRVKDLLEQGVNPCATDLITGYTPLMIAVIEGNEELLKLLLQFDACPEQFREGSYITALHYGFRFGKLKFINILLENEARVGIKIIKDIEQRRYAFTQDLIALAYKTVDVRDRDELGFTAVHVAVDNGNLRGLEILTERGVNINDRTFVDGCTPLHIAATVGEEACIKHLLERGALPNLKDEHGKIALHLLMIAPILAQDKIWIIKLLFQYGSDANVACNNGNTILHEAKAVENNLDGILICYFLVEHFAKLQHDEKYISKKNLELIQANEKFDDYYKICVDELQRIKITVISGKVTLNDFLDSTEKLPVYTRDLKVQKAFKSKHFKRNFPVYHMILIKNYNGATIERERWDRAAEGLSSTLKFFNADSPIADKILSYLSKKDHCNLGELKNQKRMKSKNGFKNITNFFKYLFHNKR